MLVSGCSNSNSAPQQKIAEKTTFTPSYTIMNEKDVSTGYAIRKTVQIQIPMGLDKKAVEDNLVQAAKEVEKKYAKPDKGLAIDIYAFSADDVKKINQGEYVTTFAECTYAHNGDWINSSTKYSNSHMEATIKINNEDYFKTKQ